MFHRYSLPIVTMFIAFALVVVSFAMPPHPSLLEKIKSGEITMPYALQHRAELLQRGFDEPYKVEMPASLDVTNFKALVLLVDFSDHPSSTSAVSFDTLMYGVNFGTVKHFFLENSYGELSFTTGNYCADIGWVRLPQTYAYYVGVENGTGFYPNNSQRMAEDAVAAVNGTINFSQYDNNGDGNVDALILVHSGPGAEFTGLDTDMWSHASTTSTSPLVDGVRVTKYSVVPEYWSVPGDMTCGVYCHELGHAMLGLPDLYDTDYTSNGVGLWSLMAGGSWNGANGNSPAHLDAWSRIRAGFATATTLHSNVASLPLPAVETTSAFYRLWTNGTSGNEYFLIENRQRTGYDAALPNGGLFIWHVDEAQTTNRNEWYPGHTSSGHFKVALEQADGLYQLEQDINSGNSGDPYPGSTTNRTFHGTSNPNSLSYAGSNTLVSITNISNSAAIMTADVAISPSYAVTSPNGGELWTRGTNATIYWSAPVSWTNVRIDLNRSYPGGTWEAIIPSTINDGSQLWSVTGAASSTARIRILNAANITQGDTSDANFTIYAPLTSLTEYFEGTFPPSYWSNTGRWTQYTYNSNKSLRLNYYSLSSGTDSLFSPLMDLSSYSTLNLQFSSSYALYSGYYDSLFVLARVNGGAWTSLWRQGGTQLANRASGTREPTAFRANSIALSPAYRVANVQFAFIGYDGYGDNLYLDSVLLTAPTTTIALTIPNGSETWYIGSSQTISWNAQPFSGNVKIELNRSYLNDSWETLFATTANDGEEIWTVTGPATTTARIRVSTLGLTPNVSDLSDADFHLLQVIFYDDQYNTNGAGTSLPWTPSLNGDSNSGDLPPVVVTFPGGSGLTPSGVQVAYGSSSPGTAAFLSMVNRYYHIEQTAGSNFNATLQFRFLSSDDAAGLRLGGGITVARSTDLGITWQQFGTGFTAAVVSGEVWEVVVPNVDGFSEWALGSGNVLPVEMSSFTAVGGEGTATLRWRTESELDNHYFNLYRSMVREVKGEVVARIDGQGTSAEPHNYTYVDHQVVNGRTYFYRISDVSFDGIERVYHNMVSVVPNPVIETALPIKYYLHQNQPNPFNPATEITFGIKKTGFVRLAVYDVTGREVAILVNEPKQPNHYRVTFDASKLPSGTYFYKLEADGFAVTKKMVLLR